MKAQFQKWVVGGGIALAAIVMMASPAAAKTIKGAAILHHPCGKVAVKHMSLVHAGKMDEAVKLGTQEMQGQWKAMPEDQKKMITGMMHDTAMSDADFEAAIKSGGELLVEGKNATLTVKTVHKDENGSSTETTTQKYVITGKKCEITQ